MSKFNFFSVLRKLEWSPLIIDAKKSRKVAYVAIMTAIAVIFNIVFEFVKLADFQLSLTFAVSILIGLILGAGAGFVSCFLGDLLGFFVNTGGNGYFPWVGISVGTVAFISGVVFHCFKSKSTFSLYLKITVVSVLTFLICSVGINTTAFWISFSSSTYFEYLFSRYILKGQLLVSVINYALVFVVVPVFKRMSFFKGLNL
ncbi:MAG: ECF transporter S component [Clostridiales bacterium]|nr:ECF transporter S component [Clostridiales bacterium]